MTNERNVMGIFCALFPGVGRIGFTFAGLLVLATELNAEPASPATAIRAVGAEGRGNVEASAAWRKLAAGNVENLVPLLEAMDGANDLAVNWLRAAVDAVVERELKAGAALPLPALGKLLLDTRHHPRARNLAFDLITRVEPATADKLLSGFLNDPSMELRREAVQQIVAQADAQFAVTNKPAATLLYQQALFFSRDATQVEEAAKKLGELGQPVDLTKHFGFLTRWKIIGPFDNTGNKGFEQVFPPEQRIDFADELDGKTGKVRWQDYTSTNQYGMVDMNKPLGKLKEVVAYATTDFYSDQARPVELRLGGKNSWKVWLNGKLLFGRDEYHYGTEIDQYPMPTQLQPGRNTILVKVCQNEQTEDWTEEWEFMLRVTDATGTPILSAKSETTASGR